MKVKLQVTSYKLQVLLAALMISGLIVAFYPSHITVSAASKTSKRLNSLIKYQNNSSKFLSLKGDSEQQAVKMYTDLLSTGINEGKNCYSKKDSQSEQEKKACHNLISEYHTKAKLLNRLLKYYQIEQKTPFICVKADLGEGTPLKARGISKPEIYANYLKGLGPDPKNPKETGRTEKIQVFLCTGENGQKKLRVQGDNGKLYKLTPDDLAREELKIENLPPKGNLDQLKERLKIKH